ncbi:hypothetical protein [Streptomyces sp. CBMA156]|uniref:hypothetical protein n=1 Tax=Streptomyces sp. CBMA156 TaxID=1930280 RepID=UPI001662174D|nr:hypothetical protein [Streptomyces sp. CBMA156]MBD0671620.1 hypothetical protein [Streptomyces sp. CBMA156]MBD0671630.1 hypothetical protein [Streptomyces sp. CBMA156]
MSRTLTGRRQAEHIARTTASSWSWVTEAQGPERVRRAAARRLARLTGTTLVRWDGKITDADWQTLLAAGADALLAQADDDEDRPVSLDLVDAAKEFAAEAAAAADTVLERTTVLPDADLPVPGRFVDAAAAEPERLPDEQQSVERWSPFEGGPRWICPSGRYGDGSYPTAPH